MKDKKQILIGLKKAHTSLGKVMKMVEEGEYCIDVMQQNLAVIGLLKSAHQLMLDDHLSSCFKNAMASNNEKIKARMTEEILKVTKLANK